VPPSPPLPPPEMGQSKSGKLQIKNASTGLSVKKYSVKFALLALKAKNEELWPFY